MTAAPTERPTCPTSADFRVAGIQVGRCAACGQLARVYGGRPPTDVKTTKGIDMATVNTELLKRTLQHIEDHPETWDQATWRNPDAECGTACCFAGWAVTLAGGQFEASQIVRIDSLPLSGETVRALQEVGIGTVGAAAIPDAAAWLLGLYEVIYDEDGTGVYLDNDPSDDLFSFDNTLDDLRYIVAGLCGEPTGSAAD